MVELVFLSGALGRVRVVFSVTDRKQSFRNLMVRNITAFSLLKIFSLILVNLSVVVHPALLVLFLHRSIKTFCFDFHR